VLRLSKKKADYEVGERKRAIARVNASPGTGKVVINGLSLEVYGTELTRLMIMEPLTLAGETAKKLDFNANVHGGGIMGQASAIRQGIGKILSKHDKTLKKKFMDYDKTLLIADVRRTEPHKPGASGRGPRRHKQRSKR